MPADALKMNPLAIIEDPLFVNGCLFAEADDLKPKTIFNRGE
jgi:hypothetical protein